jgi:hypothetical protein
MDVRAKPFPRLYARVQKDRSGLAIDGGTAFFNKIDNFEAP